MVTTMIQTLPVKIKTKIFKSVKIHRLHENLDLRKKLKKADLKYSKYLSLQILLKYFEN